MAHDWSDRIMLAHLGDEPELSDELAQTFERVKAHAPGKPAPHVVLNFESVTYLNSSHIASMLRLRKLLIESDRRLILAALSDDLWTVLMLTGLDKVFTVANDTSTALARLQLEAAGGDTTGNDS